MINVIENNWRWGIVLYSVVRIDGFEVLRF